MINLSDNFFRKKLQESPQKQMQEEQTPAYAHRRNLRDEKVLGVCFSES